VLVRHPFREVRKPVAPGRSKRPRKEVARRRPRRESLALGEVADRRPARHARVATVRCHFARDDAQQRGLAAAVGPNNTHDLARIRDQAHALKDISPSEFFGNGIYDEHAASVVVSIRGEATNRGADRRTDGQV